MTEEEFKSLPIRIEVLTDNTQGEIHITHGEKKYMCRIQLAAPGEIMIRDVLTTIDIFQYKLTSSARPF